MLVGALEEVGRRAALLAGAIESHAGAGLSLGFDGGVAYDLCKDERCSVEREVTVLDLRDHCRKRWTVLRNGREFDSGSGGLRLLHQHAVMCAVLSAADRQIRPGAGCKGQCGRDQRKAEEDEKRDRYETSHVVIVAECGLEAEVSEEDCCRLLRCTLCFCNAFATEEMVLRLGRLAGGSSRHFASRVNTIILNSLAIGVDSAEPRDPFLFVDSLFCTKKARLFAF
jgi:hypothetical protein